MAKFNPVSNRIGHVAASFNGFMIIWGGYKDQGPFTERYYPGNQLWIYDPFLENWTNELCLGQCPSGTSGASAVIVEENLYLFGGYTDLENTNNLYQLNLSTLVWRLLSKDSFIPIPSDKLVGWEYNKKLYFFGGFGKTSLNYLSVARANDFRCVADQEIPEFYRRGWNNQFICFDLEENEWSCPKYKGIAPVARAAHAAAVVKNKVFIFGGRHQNHRMNNMHYLDLDTMIWSGSLPTPGNTPEARSWHSLTKIRDNCLLLFGGLSENSQALSDCWIFNTDNYTWNEIALTEKMPRLWHTSCLLPSGELIISGGCCENILDQIHGDNGQNTKMIILPLSPKLLFKICVETVIHNYKIFEETIQILPTNIQNVIKSKKCISL